jgi:hypothetical protein
MMEIIAANRMEARRLFMRTIFLMQRGTPHRCDARVTVPVTGIPQDRSIPLP